MGIVVVVVVVFASCSGPRAGVTLVATGEATTVETLGLAAADAAAWTGVLLAMGEGMVVTEGLLLVAIPQSSIFFSSCRVSKSAGSLLVFLSLLGLVVVVIVVVVGSDSGCCLASGSAVSLPPPSSSSPSGTKVSVAAAGVDGGGTALVAGGVRTTVVVACTNSTTFVGAEVGASIGLVFLAFSSSCDGVGEGGRDKLEGTGAGEDS